MTKNSEQGSVATDLTTSDIKDIFEFYDTQHQRMKNDMIIQSALIAHYFPKYDIDYISFEMPAGKFDRLFAATEYIRLTHSLDLIRAALVTRWKPAEVKKQVKEIEKHLKNARKAMK